jgi:hypothetical protein
MHAALDDRMPDAEQFGNGRFHGKPPIRSGDSEPASSHSAMGGARSIGGHTSG